MSRVRFTRINSNKRTLGLLISKNNRKNFLEVRSQNDSFWNTVAKIEFVEATNQEELWTLTSFVLKLPKVLVLLITVKFHLNGRLYTAVYTHQGRVVRKPVNTNPGLNVNRRTNFSYMKMFFTAYVFCGLRLFKFKTEGQTI